MIMGKFKCLNDRIKYGMSLQKLYLVIRAVQVFRLYHQNCLIFEKMPAYDNTGRSNFPITLFLGKLQLVVIGAVRIFK